ncbi:hypothetical protein HMI56_005614 [Coelomomyces lativittatus]|nr:hypothetical protein HMI56_005614 [Coelomomyces lativittatus]
MTVAAFLSSTTHPNLEMIVFDQAGLALYNEKGFVFDATIFIAEALFAGITKLGDLDSRYLLLIFEWKSPESRPQRWSFQLGIKHPL